MVAVFRVTMIIQFLRLKCIFALGFFLWISLGFSNKIHAWNALGHHYIAQIAFDQLDPPLKAKLSAYSKIIDGSNFAYTASWMDRQHQEDSQWLRPMHYIDMPFSQDGSTLKAPPEINAITAIEKSLIVLKDPSTSIEERALYLRILIHVVGDIHQPLHAITRFSQKHPEGDRGGNLWYLKPNPIATNLHAYRDRGGGWLLSRKKGRHIRQPSTSP